jgi:hypothetical protein
VVLPAVNVNGAIADALGEHAAAALNLKAALAVGVLGIVRTGKEGARVMGSPSNALGTPKVFAAGIADGFGAGGERAGVLEGVVVGRVNAAAAAMALPRGVLLGVTPLRNTCTRANSWRGNERRGGESRGWMQRLQREEEGEKCFVWKPTATRWLRG